MNERLDRRALLATTASYYAAFVVYGGVVAALGPTLPALSAHTHTALSAIGFLFTARSLGYLAGSLSGGRLYDRLPGHPVLAGTLLLLAAALALIPLPHALWLLAAVMAVRGVADGVVAVGPNALLLWLHRRQAGPFINGLHVCFGIGALLSPLAVAQAVRLLDNSLAAYWLLALLALPVAACIARLPSPARRPVVVAERPRAPVDYRLVALATAFLFLYSGIESSFGGWIYSYATARQLATESAAAYLTSAFWAAITAGRLLAVVLALRLRPARLILADLVGILASLGLFLLFPGSPALTWVATVGLGLCLASVVPLTLAFVGERMAVTGLATGWFFVGLGLGSMTVPLLIGVLFQSAGPETMPAVLVVDLLAAFGLFAALQAYSARRQAMPGVRGP